MDEEGKDALKEKAKADRAKAKRREKRAERKEKKGKDKGKGKERAGTGGGGLRGPEFKVIAGDRHFLDRAGNWINCSRPPSTPCKFCGGKHWWWEGRDHGCSGGR